MLAACPTACRVKRLLMLQLMTLLSAQWTNHTPDGSFPVVCKGQDYAAMIRCCTAQQRILRDRTSSKPQMC